MVPTAWVVLDDMPMTPSGKVDRHQLPEPDGRAGVETEYVAPSSDSERALASFCQQLLGVDKVGIHDNFFHLGGHSLLATQLISRIRDELHADIPLRSIFESPSIEGLAIAIDMARKEAHDLDELSDSLDDIDALTEEQVEQLLAERKSALGSRGPGE
jgi:acyl carrier protein